MTAASEWRRCSSAILRRWPISLQLRGDAVQAPGAAEIQAVEVDELAVLAVGDHARGERELLVGELRQKLLQPGGEFLLAAERGA